MSDLISRQAQPVAKDINVPCTDTISRQAALDVVHAAIFNFFDIVEDDSESPITYQDKRILELNKSITQQIKALPSVSRLAVIEWLRGGTGCG